MTNLFWTKNKRGKMAFYEFECKKCGLIYEELTPHDETGKYKGVKCPECKSARKTKLISCPKWNFAGDTVVGTDRWNSDDRGHDYRFKYNLPSVIEKKMKANAKDHMGPNPYKHIDDISSGKNFGEVK